MQETVNPIQAAIDEGQFVLVPTSAKHIPTAAPLHNRDELMAALCLKFKLSHAESAVLTDLTVQGYIAQKELRTGPGAVRVFIYELRRKLPPNIASQIITVRGFGYALRKAGRNKIRQLLAKHDAGLIPTVRPKPKTPEPNLLNVRT